MADLQTVLLCPLDWGIGHATRCIPVIGKLQSMGFKVVVAADGRPLEFIRREYPDIDTLPFPGARITYPAGKAMSLRIIRQLPALVASVAREHRVLKKLVRQVKPVLVISDNRYGCWHPMIPSVFITHQLDIQLPNRLRLFSGLLRSVNYWFIRRYDACWIPDFEAHHGLAGRLSHPARLPGNERYIGILSRFVTARTHPFPDTLPVFDLMVMLSGPEPQRSIMEERILKQLVSLNLQVALLRGMPESDEAYVLDERIHIFSHLRTPELHELISRSAIVVCRSGFSSIMDVVTLGKRAIFIPTPGQTEQEYLARYLREKKIYFSMDQDNFDLVYALEMSVNYPGMVIRNNLADLEEQIRSLQGVSVPPSGRAR